MNILGIWDGHDSGAALLADGRLVAAVNEERLSRRKLEVRFPTAAIEACLELSGLDKGAIDIVAACTSDVAKALARVAPQTKELYYQVRRRKAGEGALSALSRRAKYWIPELRPNVVSRGLSRLCLRRAIDAMGLRRARLRLYEHHACHAAAAACASGFDPCLVLTVDGVGDGVASTVSVYERGTLRRLFETPARHSPGIFFEHVTNLLNMRELEDEGKVMALASHTAPPESNPLLQLLQPRGLGFWTAASGMALRARLRKLQWHYPNEQFARMAQDALEHACLGVAREAVRATGIHAVAIAGGVASNVRATQRIRALEHVTSLFVFPHMGDGGLALGAALNASLDTGGPTSVDLRDLALGPRYSEDEMRCAVETAGLAYESPADLPQAVAELLLQDRVVFWFQDAMEYGPRALGRRSILARADKPAVRDRLNLTLKRRVFYQPFCPSILESDARRVFSDCKGAPDRYMASAYAVAEEHRQAFAGVISADGACRPQIVRDECPSPFAALLRAIKWRTGVGALLNTSYNLHGEPLVCSPAEAVDVFRRARGDVLVMGSAVVWPTRAAARCASA
jgi:carbamoyltransferase